MGGTWPGMGGTRPGPGPVCGPYPFADHCLPKRVRMKYCPTCTPLLCPSCKGEGTYHPDQGCTFARIRGTAFFVCNALPLETFFLLYAAGVRGETLTLAANPDELPSMPMYELRDPDPSVPDPFFAEAAGVLSPGAWSIRLPRITILWSHRLGAPVLMHAAQTYRRGFSSTHSSHVWSSRWATVRFPAPHQVVW